MKKSVTILTLLLISVCSQAQEVIKTGDETSITCTGTVMAEAQHYFSNGKPSNKGKTFVDIQKDSLVFFVAHIDESSSHSVYRHSVAKKDIDNSEDAIETESVKENGAPFLVLKLKTVELNNTITTVFHTWSGIETEDPTNSLYLYFAPGKEADVKTWIEKIKAAIQQ